MRDYQPQIPFIPQHDTMPCPADAVFIIDDIHNHSTYQSLTPRTRPMQVRGTA